jgi:hypothetical protein
MTDWTVHLTGGVTITVAADEITTRQDGSLWLLAALDSPPAKLSTVLVLARGQWLAVHRADTNPLPEPAREPERVPRFA